MKTIKIVFNTKDNNYFARQVRVAASSEPNENERQLQKATWEAINSFVLQLSVKLCLDSDAVQGIKLFENEKTIAKAPQLPKITNICGKIVHPTDETVYAPGVRPYIQLVENCFGTKYRVYTTACNFDTYLYQHSTLFRGSGRKSEIQEVINHVFGNCVDRITIHQVVCSARLGHPVMQKNSLIQRQLSDILCCEVTKCVSGDEIMFLHAFMLTKFDSSFLKSINMEKVHDLSVRLNLCRTGVMNCFVSVPEGGGLAWEDEPQVIVHNFCRRIYDVVLESS